MKLSFRRRNCFLSQLHNPQYCTTPILHNPNMNTLTDIWIRRWFDGNLYVAQEKLLRVRTSGKKIWHVLQKKLILTWPFLWICWRWRLSTWTSCTTASRRRLVAPLGTTASHYSYIRVDLHQTLSPAWWRWPKEAFKGNVNNFRTAGRLIRRAGISHLIK